MEETVTSDPSIFDLPAWTGAETPVVKQDDARFAGIRFQRVGRVYHYRADGFDELKVGDYVVVETVRGKQMGQVATFRPPRDRNLGFRRIDRLATGRDMAMRHYYENKELEAMIACRAEASSLGLPIKVARAEYSFDGATLTFMFSTQEDNAEVDVEPLREAMSHLYRARIETRQIGPREVAKIIGGMGACGIEERCCSRFLTEFSPISIKHAKEQNISLNPNEITGMCGRLRCCLIYEFEQYVEARRHLPKLKSMIGTPMGEGKVVEVLALRDSVRVVIGEGPERRDSVFHREQLVPLEEFRRLQEKAQAGTCDRHEGGGCDCGRAKAKPAVQAAPQAAPQVEAGPPQPMIVQVSDEIEEVNTGLGTPPGERVREDRGRSDRPRDERAAPKRQGGGREDRGRGGSPRPAGGREDRGRGGPPRPAGGGREDRGRGGPPRQGGGRDEPGRTEQPRADADSAAAPPDAGSPAQAPADRRPPRKPLAKRR